MINQNPKISIIMPTFNGAKLIKRSIESVLKQSLADFELIIVNDGSTDNTKEIIKKFKDNRIIYLENYSNLGVSKARNQGLRIAKGKYIAYCDHDDIYYANHLKIMSRALDEHPKVGLVYGNYLEIKPGKPKVLRPDALFDKRRELANFIGTPLNVMHRKECIKKAGGFNESRIINKHSCEDLDLWLKISDNYNFLHIDKLIGEFIYHDSNRSFNVDFYKSRGYLIRKRWRKIKNTNAIAFYNHYIIKFINELIYLGYHDAAIAMSKDLYSIRKTYAVFACLGLSYFAKKNYVLTIYYLKKFLGSAPKSKNDPNIKNHRLNALSCLIEAFLKLKKDRPALDYYREVAKLKIYPIRIKQLLARYYLENKKYNMVIKILSNGNDTYCNLMRAISYFFKKEYTLAIKELNDIKMKNPESIISPYLLGLIYAKKNMKKKTKQELTKALNMLSCHPERKKIFHH